MSNNISVSIIIVSYNTKKLTEQCLQSVFKQTRDIPFEVIVSDNGSTDGSIEIIKQKFPDVILIKNNKNLGFGTANNRAVQVAKGEFVFYLNSDTVLLNNAIKIFYDYWIEHNNICALGCILQNSKGTAIHSGGQFPTYKYLCKYYFFRMLKNYGKAFVKIIHLEKFLRKLYKKRIKNNFVQLPGEIDYITGADLFIKNDENAYFDENFFLYYEETDLELRLKEKTKKKCVLLDSPKIVHLTDKGNPKRLIESKSQILNQISAIKYAKKHLVTNPKLLKTIYFLNTCNYFIKKQIKNIDPELLKF